MSSNVINQVAFLRTSREFPKDPDLLSVETNKAYVDTANAVNFRTIGIFPTNVPALNGEGWFLTQNQKQAGLRQAYPFTSFATIPHNLKYSGIERFVRLFGAYTDGTNWYGIIGGTNVAIAGQISFYITPTSIIFLNGGAPAVVKGTVVIEWLSMV